MFLPEHHQDHNFHWFEFQFLQWPAQEQKLSSNGKKKDSLGRFRFPKKVRCKSVQLGTWASSCIHLLRICHTSLRSAWGCFWFDNDPGGFVSVCPGDVTSEGMICSWKKKSIDFVLMDASYTKYNNLFENKLKEYLWEKKYYLTKFFLNVNTWKSCRDPLHSDGALWLFSTSPTLQGQDIPLGYSKVETLLPH